MEQKLEQIRKISNRLVWALIALIGICIPGAYLAQALPGSFVVSAPLMGMAVGFVGGFVGLQRRLKTLPADDLTLLANSWVCISLSPIVGGILAVVTYVLFASGLLAGDMFPKMIPDSDPNPITQGVSQMFAIHCEDAASYTKLLFWCFLAGFSERFATNIIGQFESRASGDGDGKSPQ